MRDDEESAVALLPRSTDRRGPPRFVWARFAACFTIFLLLCSGAKDHGLPLNFDLDPPRLGRALSVLASALVMAVPVTAFWLLIIRAEPTRRAKRARQIEAWRVAGLTTRELDHEIAHAYEVSFSRDEELQRAGRRRVEWLEAQREARRTLPPQPTADVLIIGPTKRAKTIAAWIGGAWLFLALCAAAICIAAMVVEPDPAPVIDFIFGVPPLTLLGAGRLSHTWTASLRLTADRLEMRRFFRTRWSAPSHRVAIRHGVLAHTGKLGYELHQRGTEHALYIPVSLFPRSEMEQLTLALRSRRAPKRASA